MKQKVDDQREYHANKLQGLQDKQERDRQRSVQPLLLLLLLMLSMTVAIVVMLIVLSLLLCADFNYTVSQKKQGVSNTRPACGLRNCFVRPAAMSTNFKIFWIKTTCSIHFTRKYIIRLTYLHLYGAFPLTWVDASPTTESCLQYFCFHCLRRKFVV